jgi:hypothetical protein
VRRNQECANDKNYTFTFPSDADSLFNKVLPPARNRAKVNKRILEPAADLVTATNLSCHQTTSPAMHEFILKLV